jgi:hypothetical protein
MSAAAPAAIEGTRARSPYIAGPLYDWAFFLLPPLLSILVGAAIAGTPFAEHRFWMGGKRATWASLSLGVIIHAHLVAVLVRSHLNPSVFQRHRFRFVAVPIAAFAAMMLSSWAVAIATVLVTFWDVYHSALQTFGLGRIYDRNAGNDPVAGRKLDLWLNVLLYAGPIVAGACMLAHFSSFEAFADVDAAFFTSIPVFMQSHQRLVARGVVGLGTAFVAFYVAAYVRLAARGYKVAFPKVFLLATTGLCSVWVWGFNPWGQAFFIMNLFHAVQYLGLVWWSERGVLVRRLGLSEARVGKPLAAALFLGAALGYGVFAELAPSDDRLRWSLVQMVALMHFFYDGFIWSVRKRQI